MLQHTLCKAAKFKLEKDLNSGKLKHAVCKQISCHLEKAEFIEFGKEEDLQEQS